MSERICKCGHSERNHSKENWACMSCHVCGSFRLNEGHEINKSLAAMKDYDRQRTFLASGKAEKLLENIKMNDELPEELQTSDLVLGRIRKRKIEKPFDDFQFKWEMKVSIAEHETMLTFNSDWQSLAFEDWLSLEGMWLFAEWLKENKENYEQA